VPLRRADRLFDIIRILHAASQPVTAAAIRSVMLAFDEILVSRRDEDH
jgi:predicted DNA-binding transcriptional regulator YafY